MLIARDFLGDEDFVMYLGDNFIVGGITRLTEEFATSRPDAQIMLPQVDDPRAFGVAELDAAGCVVGLEEKPQVPRSDLALVGVYSYTAIAERCILDDSEIEYSILLSGASIRGVGRIEASLIGHDADVTPPHACRERTDLCSATAARYRSARGPRAR